MVFPLCNFDLASTLFIPADDLINDVDDEDDEDEPQAEPSRQTGNTTDTRLPLIFHFVLRYLQHSPLRTRELQVNSAHFDSPVVLMWWNISCHKLTR